MVDFAKGTVVSTRVRLARNLDGYAFPSRLDYKHSREIIRRVSSGLSHFDNFRLIYMDDITEDEGRLLVENHLVSPNLVANTRGGAVLINNEEFLSIMINEEDHLREQCIVKGFDLPLAYTTMSEIDEQLAKSVKFAYDEQLGYLTSCPTNLGTGLRASVMLFLPALTLSGRINDVIRSAAPRGLTVRGMYGEGSKAEGYTYQISNERTLGISEQDILDVTEKAVRKVIEYEASARSDLINSSAATRLKDKCLRSFGIVTNCAIISSDEFRDLCSNIKLGACLGYIAISDVAAIDALVVKMQPANLNAAASRELTPDERDVYRATQGGAKIAALIGK